MAEQSGGNQTAAKKTAKAVQYVGGADIREITKSQWGKAKVEDQNLVRWSAENDYTVPVSDLNEKALAILEKDPGFKMVDVEA